MFSVDGLWIDYLHFCFPDVCFGSMGNLHACRTVTYSALGNAGSYTSEQGIPSKEIPEYQKKITSDCSIIFLTAFNEFDYARKAISVHALEYLLKPCDDKELVLSVEEAIRVRKLHEGSSKMEAFEDAELRKSSTADAILKYIEGHFADELSVQVMAEKFAYSEVYFCRLFKQHFGESFVSFLTDYRIGKAVELLQTTKMSVKDIGRAVGYEDSNYFTKVFKRVMKVIPSEFRAQNQ